MKMGINYAEKRFPYNVTLLNISCLATASTPDTVQCARAQYVLHVVLEPSTTSN